MGYLYALINKTNGKKFLGKSNLEYKLLKQMLYEALDEEKHYNKLLQEDWKKYNFELKQILSDDCSKDFDEIIRGEELLNPLYGYNLFNDLQNKKGRHKVYYGAMGDKVFKSTSGDEIISYDNIMDVLEAGKDIYMEKGRKYESFKNWK